jgi:miniconductance mechanosensitive channel
VTPLIIGFFTGFFPAYEIMIKRVLSAYVTLVLLLIIDSLLNAADDIYRTFDISKTRPIKGILQVIKIVAFVVGGIVIISSLIGQNPLILLGGLGALSAVIILVFQSSILGFVAGLQMTSNDMVRIGDWIEMPKYDADGTVIDLTLTTVKVRNFDNTITTIPAHAMISDSFRNWRGMKASGGRRIKRSIHIDVTSIGFLTEEMIEELSKVEHLKEYIADKRKEIEIYNKERNIDISVPVNGRRMTNIGTFRFYVYNYLRNHPGIHKGMTLMVRQLSPGSTGLPLEVYAFTATTEWIEYENIQSDIFDHLLAVLPHFGLRAFQEPAGYDIVSLRKNGVFE